MLRYWRTLKKNLAKVLPKDNELPKTTYEAKKVVCPLALDMVKYHACLNDYLGHVIDSRVQ